jgi:hypothetical protein
MLAEGRTPIPADRRKSPDEASGGYAPYTPWHQRSKFLRYQLAEFRESEAEQLRDKTYDQLIQLKWLKAAESQAKTDHQEYLIRTRKKQK